MSDLSKKMRSLFDTWPRALPYAVKNSDDVGLHEQAAAAAILNRHRATPRQDLLALCAEIEALEKENEYLRDAITLRVREGIEGSWLFEVPHSAHQEPWVYLPFDSLHAAVDCARKTWTESPPEVRARWAPNYVGPKPYPPEKP